LDEIFVTATLCAKPGQPGAVQVSRAHAAGARGMREDWPVRDFLFRLTPDSGPG
jgi:hypothetical protein